MVCPLGHVLGCPGCPAEGDCHCDDQPLVTGAIYAPVVLEEPALAGGLAQRVEELADRLRSGLGLSETAPPEPGGARVAREEDPIVLLR